MWDSVLKDETFESAGQMCFMHPMCKSCSEYKCELLN